ncbi:unnamed protein product [marine sediment metagenome]|uniref:Glycosyltransferase 2-like domain-containing protein n=1 Tax=marine sediment metagenome TaxID=412755 RepID=X1CIB9_9ZZZZ
MNLGSKIFLSVVIPVYNSEKTINLVVEKIKKVLSDKLTYEIILLIILPNFLKKLCCFSI